MNIVVGERGHGDQCGFRTCIFKISFEFLVPGSRYRPREANTSDDLMSSSGKQTQHAHGIGFVTGLAENLAIDDDDRVCSQNNPAELLTKYRLRFLPRQPFSAIARTLSCLRYFRNI